MYAEGYSGFNDLYRSGAVSEVACLLGSMLRMRLLGSTWLIYGASSLICSNRKGWPFLKRGSPVSQNSMPCKKMQGACSQRSASGCTNPGQSLCPMIWKSGRLHKWPKSRTIKSHV
ncbi:hypothetical protein [Phaeobacter inhibens]|uniref:hypothetical protein n=1 Tax=Phaeobacter inhibens TaxID=221822 RepID=UPI0039F14CB7